MSLEIALEHLNQMFSEYYFCWAQNWSFYSIQGMNYCKWKKMAQFYYGNGFIKNGHGVIIINQILRFSLILQSC